MENETIKKIIECLKGIGPHKVILFGSSASGSRQSESDIDLLVVTEDEFIPKNFREKNEIYLKVANSLQAIEDTVAIDLIVHTKGMHKRFIELESMFSSEILEHGRVIYEKDN